MLSRRRVRKVASPSGLGEIAVSVAGPPRTTWVGMREAGGCRNLHVFQMSVSHHALLLEGTFPREDALVDHSCSGCLGNLLGAFAQDRPRDHVPTPTSNSVFCRDPVESARHLFSDACLSCPLPTFFCRGARPDTMESSVRTSATHPHEAYRFLHRESVVSRKVCVHAFRNESSGSSAYTQREKERDRKSVV